MISYLKRYLKLLMLTTFFFFASIAQANFLGDYDVGNWTIVQSGVAEQSVNAEGSVDTTGAPASILIIEPDLTEEEEIELCGNFPDLCEQESEVAFLIEAAADGILAFDWSFDTNPDDCCSAATVYNGERGILYDFGDSVSGPFDELVPDVFSGNYSMSILAGDIIGFGVWSEDTCCGANTLTISNFSVSEIPVPAAIWLFGTALIGLAGFSKRRKANHSVTYN